MKKSRILVIDDELFIRTMVQDVLKAEGFGVITAAEGNEAVERMTDEEPEIVILDIMMPGQTGLDLVPTLKQHNPNVMIIIITAYPSLDVAENAIKKGAYDFIRKPFEPEELIQSVKRAFDHSRTLRENRELLKELGNQVDVLSRVNELLAQEKGKLETILKSMAEAVLVTDDKGNIEICSTVAVNLFGLPQENTEINIGDLDAPAELIEAAGRCLERGETVIDKLLMGDPESKYRMVLSPLKYDRFESSRGMAVLLEDITEMSRLDELRSRFIEEITHTLRTPLTSLQGAAGILKKKEFDEKNGKLINIIDKETEKLSRLVESIIDSCLPGDEGEKGKEKVFHVKDVLREAISRYTRDLKLKKIKPVLRIEKQIPRLIGDVRILEKIIENLLDNAVRFTPENGNIVLTAEYVRESSGIRVEVRDSGNGIPEKEKKRLFSKYDDSGGSGGLGLPFSRFLVEMCGGNIGLKEDSTGGTCITFILPMKTVRGKYAVASGE